MSGSWTERRAEAAARWSALAPRERMAVMVAAGFVAVLLLWWIAIAPAWRTLSRAPAQMDELDAQIQQMQRLAAEARELKGAVPVTPSQAEAALKSATQRLGERGTLTVRGDRATLKLTGIDGVSLRDWLNEVRSGARARAVDVQLTRDAKGYAGTIVVSLGGGT